LRCRLGCGLRMDLTYHVLHGGPNPQCEGASLRGKRAGLYKGPWAVQKRLNQSRCRLGCGLSGPKELCIRWGPGPPQEGALLRGMTSGFFRTPSSTVPSGPHVGISLRAVHQCSDWLADEVLDCHMKFSPENPTAMRPVVKILWPLVIIRYYWQILVESMLGDFQIFAGQNYTYGFNKKVGGSCLRNTSTTTDVRMAFCLQLTTPLLVMRPCNFAPCVLRGCKNLACPVFRLKM